MRRASSSAAGLPLLAAHLGLIPAAAHGLDRGFMIAAGIVHRILADQARLEEELARTRAAMAANEGRWSLCGISFGVVA